MLPLADMFIASHANLTESGTLLWNSEIDSLLGTHGGFASPMQTNGRAKYTERHSLATSVGGRLNRFPPC